jgi:hypothetical protein
LKLTVVLTVLSLALLGDIGTKTAEAKTLTVSEKKVLTKNLRESKNTIRWFKSRKHQWRLHKRFETCNNVTRLYSPKRGAVCYKSRLAYRAHKERIERLTNLLYPLPPHYAQWNCIMFYEAWHHGKWAAHTGNGYYGGLQMDLDFQRAYGPELLRTKGTANNWTALEQMWVAERAWRKRGFYPWPNTARYCGLI